MKRPSDGRMWHFTFVGTQPLLLHLRVTSNQVTHNRGNQKIGLLSGFDSKRQAMRGYRSHVAFDRDDGLPFALPTAMTTPPCHTYRTLCDLPTELLQEIIAYSEGNTYWFKRLALVCRCLRPICQDSLFRRRHTVCRVREKESYTRFIKFLEERSRIASHIVDLTLTASRTHWVDVDVVLLVRIVRNMPRLHSLILACVRYRDAHEVYATHFVQPRPLRRLELRYTAHELSSLAAILHIMSLYTVEDLVMASTFDPGTACHVPPVPTCQLRARNIRLWRSFRRPENTPRFLDALAANLVPGHLRQLEVQLDSNHTLHALKRLLAGPASDIDTLNLKSIPPEETFDDLQGKLL